MGKAPTRAPGGGPRASRAGRVILFALLPMLPVIVVLIVSGTLFTIDFVARHLDIVAIKPTHALQYFAVEDALRAANQPLADTRDAILRRQAALTSEPPEGADTVAEAAFATEKARRLGVIDKDFRAAATAVDQSARGIESTAAAVIDPARPVALSSNALMSALAAAMGETAEQVDLTARQLERCECPGPTFETLSVAHTDIAEALTRINDVLAAWAIAKARQSGAMMSAVNATIILLVVAAAASVWSVAHLLPHRRFGGARLGGLVRLRMSFIAVSALIFLGIVLAPVLMPPLPLMPYRTITLTLFDRTLAHGLAPGGPIFLFWNYIAIGLVASALFATFALMSAASWTYDYRRPLVAAVNATQRMAIVRNSLYLAALTCIASLIAIQADFNAASSLFADGPEAAPNPTRVLIDTIGSVIVQATGIGLGLALAAAYLPAAVHLYSAYEAEKAAAASGAARATFSLFDSGTFGMALRFLAIIAPALIEPISKLIGGD